MCQVINLAQYKAEKELKAQQKEAVNNLSKISDREEFDYEFLKVLDWFIRERYPQIFGEFDIWLKK